MIAAYVTIDATVSPRKVEGYFCYAPNQEDAVNLLQIRLQKLDTPSARASHLPPRTLDSVSSAGF